MLSHVCSRFRVLVVSSVHLWNRISPSMHSEAISTCFDRCGATGIQIVINTRNCAGLATFIPAAIEKSHLWRKFAHNCTSMTSSLADFIRHLNSVGEWRLQAPNLIAPTTFPSRRSLPEFRVVPERRRSGLRAFLFDMVHTPASYHGDQ